MLAAVPVHAQVCSSDAQCDDDIACTIDRCVQEGFFRVCAHTPDGVDCRLEVADTSSATCDHGNDGEHSCVFTSKVSQPSIDFGLTGRFGWGLCADPNATHDRSINGEARHGVSFLLTTPGGYRLDVTHSWRGLLRADSSTIFGGTSDANVSGVDATWQGPGAVVPDLSLFANVSIHSVPGLPDPGSAHVNAAEIDDERQTIDASASFSIYDRSNGQPREHALDFAWDGHARGEEAYGSVRLGEGFWDADLDDSGNCLYPGSPSRSQSADGHMVDVKVVPLCGNGQIDAEVGEECDPNDADGACCTTNCTLCCGDGVANPGETCDPTISGSNCPLVCDAFDFTAADWQTSRMSLVDSAAWADDGPAVFAPVHQRLRLTPTTAGAKGSAWYNASRVDPSRDWSANFSFQNTFADSIGADGLSLILQRDGLGADFHSGVDGTPTTSPYLAMGVDTYLNPGLDAFQENLEVHVNGTFPAPNGSPTQGLNLANSNFGGCAGDLQNCIYTLYARYTAATRMLVVTVTSPNHAGSVTGTWNLDLAALLGTTGDYRVGFAGNTGAAVENHDVLRWAFIFQPRCGNGFVEAGEQCDAGAAVGTAGSCCSATCGFKVTGTACTDDGNVCTDDRCNGVSASCQHPFNTAPCTDGLFCNGADTCTRGGCAMHAGNPCPGPDGDGNCAESCNEAADACNQADPTGSSCSDGLFCTGDDFCAGGICTTRGTNPCRGPDGDTDCAESCDEGSDTCTAPDPAGTLCRAAAGACDVAETCTGTSAACPSDGFVDAATVCRAGVGECDPAEHCTGGAATCPADLLAASGTPCTADTEACTLDACDGAGVCAHTPTADTDGDGGCDEQDPCTNVGGAQDFVTPPKAKLTLSKINVQTTPNDDAIVLQGTFDLPSGKTFGDLQPDTNGARLIVDAHDGTNRVDVTLAAGAYGGRGMRGWKRSKNRKVWTFLDQTGTPANGIVRFELADVAKQKAPSRVRVKISGKDGNYPVLLADSPIAAIVTLGNQTDAAAGLCAESAYAAADCTFNRSRNALTCRR